jgi:DNA-binding GntR family transcriptional regulator
MPAEHKLIYEAILQGDAETAQDSANVHISRLKDLVVSEGSGEK